MLVKMFVLDVHGSSPCLLSPSPISHSDPVGYLSCHFGKKQNKTKTKCYQIAAWFNEPH